MISLHTSNKIVKPKNVKGGSNSVIEAVQHVQAWGLRCDPCYAYSKQETAKLNKSRTVTLDSWANETGCSTRKLDKWTKHISSKVHISVVNVDRHDDSKSGIMSQSLGAKQRVDNAVRALFRILMYVAQKKRPLADINDIRSLHAINGNSDLSLDPRTGVLSDPSANYSSEAVLQEMLEIAADQVNLKTAAMLKKCEVITFTLDESTCNSNFSQLLIYSNQMVGLPHDPDLTEPHTRLLACIEVIIQSLHSGVIC